MKHQNIFLVETRARRAAAPGGLDRLFSLLWQCLAVNGFALLISFAVFLAASPGIRFLIVAVWVAYLVAATAFVISLIADARSAR